MLYNRCMMQGERHPRLLWESRPMLPMRFFAVAAIALAPILNAMGNLSNLQAWLIVAAGGGWLMFWSAVRFDAWLHELERRPPRRRIARVRRTGRVMILKIPD